MRRMILLPLVAAALAVPAIAQQFAPQQTGQGAARGERPDPAAMERRRGDDMAVVLGLSAVQRTLLDAFLAHGQPPAPPIPPAPDAAPPSFGQELDRMQQDMARHMADERQHLQAARLFYGSLDARQKAVFDALMRLSHDGPGGPRGGPRGPGGPHGRGGPDGPPPPAQ